LRIGEHALLRMSWAEVRATWNRWQPERIARLGAVLEEIYDAAEKANRRVRRLLGAIGEEGEEKLWFKIGREWHIWLIPGEDTL